MDGFVQVYRDVDDLFEDDEEGGGQIGTNASDDDDLKRAFERLAENADDGKRLSFSRLRRWEDIVSLVEVEGTLGEDEFLALWEASTNDPTGESSSSRTMDFEGFSKFNSALDDLFVDEDDDDEDLEDVDEDAPASSATLPVVDDADLPPGVLFSRLADGNCLVGKR